MLEIGTDTEPDELKEEESQFVDDWDYEESRQIFEEDTRQTTLEVAVGKIATAVVGAVTTVATGGAAAPALVGSIKNVVLNAGWSQSDKKDKIVKKVFHQNVCIYLEIHTSTKMDTKNAMGSSKQTTYLRADTKFTVMTAKSNTAMKKLKAMKLKQVEDKQKYIDSRDGWCDEQTPDERKQKEEENANFQKQKKVGRADREASFCEGPGCSIQ